MLECRGFLSWSSESKFWVMRGEQSSGLCCWNEGNKATVMEVVQFDANADGVL